MSESAMLESMPKPSTQEPYHCEKCNVTVAIKEAHLRSKKHDPENYVLRSSTRKLYHCEKCDCDVGNMCNHLKSKKHNPEKYDREIVDAKVKIYR